VRKLPAVASILFVIIALVIGVAAVPIGAADHLDSPLVMTDGQLDINDVYAFQSPAKATNSVLIMTTTPLAGVQNPATFSSTGAYEIKVDTNGDAKEDITYTFTFSAPNAAGAQTVTVKSGSTTLGSGSTGTAVSLSNGGTATAGTYDDPFFFDLAAFKNNLAFCPGGVGTNFFSGLNVNAIVLEVPSSTLGTKIGVWARTLKDGKQFDRMGRPAINTVFIGAAKKDGFNATNPVDDQKNYTADVVAVLKALVNDDATATKLAGVLLPDILTFDTSSAEGFLNGRKLGDDVIDAELGLITGNKVKGDCVASDSPFRATSPYLAPMNGMPGLPSTGGGGATVLKTQQTIAWWAIIAMIASLAAAGVSGMIALRGRKR
jgi:hypothetical protein